jgi:nitroreductase
MEVLPEIANWVSTDHFENREIAEEVLDRLVEAARRAPSAKNRQPWRLVVARKEDVRARLAEAAFGQDPAREAMAVAAFCTTNTDYRMPNGHHAYPLDIGIAAAFMMVQARVEGLGVHPMSTYDEQEVKEILTVPHSMRVALLVLLGWPAESPLLKERRPTDQIVSYDHW